jgi:hypothetical protein
MMVIISGARFVQSRTTCWFDSTDDSGGGKRIQIVIDSLARKGTEPLSSGDCNEFRILVFAFMVKYL